MQQLQVLTEYQEQMLLFFSKSKLPLQKWLLILYLWEREYQVSDAVEEAEISAGNRCNYQMNSICSD